MRQICLLTILLHLFAGGCDQPRYNFDVAFVPLVPENFEVVNSYYDDYNSAGPMIFTDHAFGLVFSTNRNSNGRDFDFVVYQCWAFSNEVTGSFSIQAEPFQDEIRLLDTINSADNEWGPYLTKFPFLERYSDHSASGPERIFYTSDRDGNLDIFYWAYTSEYSMEPLDSGALTGLNTGFDEGYLTLHPGAISDREVCYFTSNRDGNFDIFRAEGGSMEAIEQAGSLLVNKVEVLSGPGNDKCPYIVNDMMVFTSDRDGGFGGYDLWYSTWNGSTWMGAVNFGAGINTEYNEYRPVVIPTESDIFLNNMMIFSSDRPDGKGGYDLYYVGMKQWEGYFQVRQEHE